MCIQFATAVSTNIYAILFSGRGKNHDNMLLTSSNHHNEGIKMAPKQITVLKNNPNFTNGYLGIIFHTICNNYLCHHLYIFSTGRDRNCDNTLLTFLSIITQKWKICTKKFNNLLKNYCSFFFEVTMILYFLLVTCNFVTILTPLVCEIQKFQK